jgi:hypothetical protein
MSDEYKEYILAGKWRCSHSPTGAHHWLEIATNTWQCKYCDDMKTPTHRSVSVWPAKSLPPIDLTAKPRRTKQRKARGVANQQVAESTMQRRPISRASMQRSLGGTRPTLSDMRD